MVDLRSDTLTKPSPAMRQAMYQAEVGDDVFGEDPTVRALEAKASGLLGREAAVFLPSGTMSNQIAIKVLSRAGDEILLSEGAHAFMFEGGAAAVISAVQLRTLAASRGILSPESIEAAIRPDDPHHPPTRLVCLENTHNRGGGAIYPLATIQAIHDLARRRGLYLHLDGARLFNASVASGHGPAEYARYFDTVCFCLSKGLGAPVGSLLVGDGPTILEARRWRKRLGGGMRQVGILAAAGLYALENNVARLAEDHANAQTLARGLARFDALRINPDEVETNIVIFQVIRAGLNATELADRLKEHGVLVLPVGPNAIRAVTHLDVDRAGIDQAIAVMEHVLNR